MARPIVFGLFVLAAVLPGLIGYLTLGERWWRAAAYPILIVALGVAAGAGAR